MSTMVSVRSEASRGSHVESAVALLEQAASQPPAAFSTSLGAEDMVLLDLISRKAIEISSFTLDTGRLHEQTYQLLETVEKRYGRIVQVFTPDANELEALVAERGINGFYASVDNRKACCTVRKLQPLARALAGKRAWVTGLRASQSDARKQLEPCEWDEARGLHKFNPLHDWSDAQIWDYIRANDVPYNVLHQFFPSIGCAPCTRAITPGEDVRAGRWWWEQEGGKECGLHVRPLNISQVKATA